LREIRRLRGTSPVGAAASLAISSGAHVKVVQRMLGHASAAMTLDTYADLFDADLDTVAESVGKMWANVGTAP
jgi:integrase